MRDNSFINQEAVDLLRSRKLGQVFDNTSATYKFYWMLGILDLLPLHNDGIIPIREIQARMVARAFPTIAYFKLSFGKQDSLGELITNEIIGRLGLDPKSSAEIVALKAHSLGNQLDNITQIVPFRFLSPWIDNPKGLRSSKRDREIADKARESQAAEEPAPYFLDEQCIHIGDEWRAFLLENRVAIEDYTKLRLVGFLESRNPHAHNITQKLEIPTERDLTAARRFWGFTLDQNRGQLVNIYTGKALEAPFAVDHFIPFSFEARDQLWNLIPTDKASNSRKSDNLYDFEPYQTAYAEVHWRGIQAHSNQSQALADHCDALRVTTECLLTMSKDELGDRLRDLLVPRIVRAANCGFIKATYSQK